MVKWSISQWSMVNGQSTRHHPTSKIQNSTFKIQHSKFNISTSNPTCGNQHQNRKFPTFAAMKRSVALHTLVANSTTPKPRLSGVCSRTTVSRKKVLTNSRCIWINTCSVTDNPIRNAACSCGAYNARHRRPSCDHRLLCTAEARRNAAIPGEFSAGCRGEIQHRRTFKDHAEWTPRRSAAAILRRKYLYPHPTLCMNEPACFLKYRMACDYNCSFCTIPMARGKSRSDRTAIRKQRAGICSWRHQRNCAHGHQPRRLRQRLRRW